MNLLNLGVNQVFFDAVVNGAQNSTAFALPTLATQVSWQTSFGSAPASVTLQLQTSLDNVIWSTIDTSTSTTGESRTINTSALFVRVRENAVSGGSTTTVNVVCKSGVVGNVLTPSSVTDGSLALFDGTTGSKLKELVFPADANQVLKGNGTFGTIAGTGDVVGPSSATDNHVAFFNGATGKLIKDSGLALSGSNTGDQFGSTTASKLLGRGSAGGTGAAQEITLGTNLSLSGTTLNATGGGGTPGGANTSIQFNNSSAFGGFGTWDGSLLTISGNLNINNLLFSPAGTNGNSPTAGIDLIVSSGLGGTAIADSAANGEIGGALNIFAGNGGDGDINNPSRGGTGGTLNITAGSGGFGNNDRDSVGGDLILSSGTPSNSTGDARGNKSGNLSISTPAGSNAHGSADNRGGNSGSLTIITSAGGTAIGAESGGDAGALQIISGSGGNSPAGSVGNPGPISILGGIGGSGLNGGSGGQITIYAGDGGAPLADGNGGDGAVLNLQSGDGSVASGMGNVGGIGGDIVAVVGFGGAGSSGATNGANGNFRVEGATEILMDALTTFRFTTAPAIFDSSITATIFIPTTGYKSVDLSTGITQDVTTGTLVGKTMTFKNGLLVGFA